jgi:hypothetical protein
VAAGDTHIRRSSIMDLDGVTLDVRHTSCFSVTLGAVNPSTPAALSDQVLTGITRRSAHVVAIKGSPKAFKTIINYIHVSPVATVPARSARTFKNKRSV